MMCVMSPVRYGFKFYGRESVHCCIIVGAICMLQTSVDAVLKCLSRSKPMSEGYTFGVDRAGVYAKCLLKLRVGGGLCLVSQC